MKKKLAHHSPHTDHVIVPVLALDGPSGSGKGAVGQTLAKRLGWHFLDSGALYRLLALVATRNGILSKDPAALARLAEEMKVAFVLREGASVGILLDGHEVDEALRTEEIGRQASIFAAIPKVRAALLQKQQALRQSPGLVADGRDMGTTVFPDALLKVFLTATPEIRAERRHKQLIEKGFDVNLRRLLDEIRARDARDAERATSPLKPAVDAHVLDTSCLDLNEVVNRILELLGPRVNVAK